MILTRQVKIPRLPIRGVLIEWHVSLGADKDEVLRIFDVEKESSLNVEAITQLDEYGRIRRIGYNVEATIYFSYSLTDGNFIDTLENLNVPGTYTIQILLGSADGYAYAEGVPPDTPEAINSDGSAMLVILNNSASYAFSIESVGVQRRIKLQVRGFLNNLSDYYEEQLKERSNEK